MEGLTLMQNLTPDYIVGLVDGEGSFTIYVRNLDVKNNVQRRVRIEPKFYLKLIEKDKDILYQLKKFFGCGSVYFQKDTRLNHQHCYRYEVYKRDDIKKIIIPFFQRNKLQLASKRNDFQIFCELMSMIERDHHLTDEGLKEMYLLKQNMH